METTREQASIDEDIRSDRGDEIAKRVDASHSLKVGAPQITKTILSHAVTTAIGQMDAKFAFDMMLLNEQIITLDLESKALKEENAFLKEKLAKQTQEQSEMYHYLHGKLDQQLILIATLEKEVATGNETLDDTIQRHSQEMEAAQISFKSESQNAQEQITALQAELLTLRLFSEQKQQLEAHMQELEEELANRTKHFQEEKRELERKSLFEKDRVKKEMLMRMKETKEGLLLRTEGQANSTTMRTMMENEHFMNELSFQSRETEKIMSRFEVLEEEVKKLRIQNKLLEENERTMAKKNYHYQKILHQLQKKEDKHRMDALSLKSDQDGTQMAAAGDKEEKTQVDHDEDIDLRKRVQELEATLRKAEEWIRRFQKEKQYLIAQQDEIIQFLCRAVQEVSTELHEKQGVPRCHTEESRDQEEFVLALSKNTTHMDDWLGTVPLIPQSPLDELSSEDSRLVLLFLLEKMRVYQQRTALLYQPNSSKHTLSPNKKQRDVMARQLGVELPPILPNMSVSSSSQDSPLKQKRRIFAHVSTAVTNAVDDGNQDLAKAKSKWTATQQHAPSPTLVNIAVNPFNFLSTSTTPSIKSSPAKKQQQNTNQPSQTASPVKNSKRCLPLGTAIGSPSLSTEQSQTEGMESNLLHSKEMPTAWSTTSIASSADAIGFVG